MKKYIHMGLLSLFLVGVFSACERMSDVNAYTLSGSAEAVQDTSEGNDEKNMAIQAALHEDAQLARSMPLKQYARYMKTRHVQYRQHNLMYEDDFVKIMIAGDKMKLETPKGKVKIEYKGE